MEQIKAYKPETNSVSSGQVLHCPYDFDKAKLVVKEMTDLMVLDLVDKRLVTDQIVLTIGYDIENLTDPNRSGKYNGDVTIDRYGRKVPKHAHGTTNLKRQTSSTMLITDAVMELYDRIVDKNLLGKELCELDREVICIVNLRTDGIPLNCNFVSVGVVDQSIAHPREIFKSSILSNATSMILIHNHPSGNLEPSKWDTILTDRMLKLGELIGIPVVDHIIVGGENKEYFSFKEKGILEFEHNSFEIDYRKLDAERFAVAENEIDHVVTPRRRRSR